MQRIFSNGPERDFVINPFNELVTQASRLRLAAPYFSHADAILRAAAAGKQVQLIIGLNSATRPEAVAAVVKTGVVAIRYLTARFHAKIYLSEHAVLLGSSNLTSGGLTDNREAVIVLDRPEDFEAIEQTRALFSELWESAAVLTPAVYARFSAVWNLTRQTGPDRDDLIANEVGKAEPTSTKVGSGAKSRERLFLDQLQRQVWEQYRPAFADVGEVLTAHGFRRPELEGIGIANETNRFLNWVRLTKAPGVDSWANAPTRAAHERRAQVVALGPEWVEAQDSRVPETYVAWLASVQRLFGTPDAMLALEREGLTEGLMSLHAFTEQERYVPGGRKALPDAFWKANHNQVDRVRATLTYLVHGGGDFVERLHDVLYAPERKLSFVGRFTALELFGTVRPEECPPMNSRMAKALKYLGYDVSVG